MKNVRLLHRYMGLFFSPAILFFAFSGALQTFNLHKPNKTTGYVPPAWLLELSQLHKDQRIAPPKVKAKAAPVDSDSEEMATPKKAPKSEKSTLPLKGFTLVMSIGLIVSTLLGIYMAFRYGGDWRLVGATLIGGTVLPVTMMLL